MNEIRASQLPDLFENVAEIMVKEKENLCAMDAEMGDGDLGLTMAKGFSSLPDIMRQLLPSDDVGMVLMKAGMKMASVVPSTMGTLMASGIMGGGSCIKGSDSLTPETFYKFLKGFSDSIAKRGKCKRGERTILDATASAVDLLDKVFGKGEAVSLEKVIDFAISGASEGVESTKSMKPVHGKAAVFASKAIGKPDQGASAFCCMLKGMRTYICGR